MMTFGMPYLLEMSTLADAACLCHELSLSFVEVNANFPACQDLNAAALREFADRWKIGFTLHIEEECDPFTFNADVRRAWQGSLVRSLRLARDAHMPIVNMHFPHGVYITLPTEKVFLYERYRDGFQQALREFVALVESELLGTGITLCIENTNGWHPHERAAIEQLLASPCIGLTLDIGHCHGVNDIDEDFFQNHRSKLTHMHAHDALGRRDHLPLGTGEIDLRARFALAAQCNALVVLETKTIAALRESVGRLPEYLP